MKRQIVALAAEETRMIMWDIDAVLADHQNTPWISVATWQLVPREWLSIDREYAMGTDPERVVLVFEIMDGLAFLADEITGCIRPLRRASRKCGQLC